MDIWSVFLHNIFCEARGNPSYLPSEFQKYFGRKTQLSPDHRIPAGAGWWRTPGPRLSTVLTHSNWTLEKQKESIFVLSRQRIDYLGLPEEDVHFGTY